MKTSGDVLTIVLGLVPFPILQLSSFVRHCHPVRGLRCTASMPFQLPFLEQQPILSLLHMHHANIFSKELSMPKIAWTRYTTGRKLLPCEDYSEAVSKGEDASAILPETPHILPLHTNTEARLHFSIDHDNAFWELIRAKTCNAVRGQLRSEATLSTFARGTPMPRHRTED